MKSIDRSIRVNVTNCILIIILGCTLVEGAFSQQTELNAAQQAYADRDWSSVVQILENTATTADDQRLLALAYYQQKDFDNAQPRLWQAVTQWPNDRKLREALLETWLARGDHASALAYLNDHSAADDDPNTWFARMRIALAQNDPTEARRQLDRLLQQDNARLAQEAAAEYIEYAQAQGQHTDAYQIAQQALARDSDSFLSFRFRQINDVSATEESQSSPWKFTLGYRLEYDDNVALLPDSLLPSGDADADEDDFRHVVTADVLYQQALGGNWQVFGEARATQSIHHQASEFNFTRLNGLLGTGQSFNRWGWRLPAEISHDRFDGDSFSTTFTVSPGAYFKITQNFYTHVYGRYASSDFDQVAFPEDDRSAETYGGGLLLAGNITRRWTVRAIGEYLDFDADGSNWDREEIQGYLYTEYSLTPDWSVGAGARYTDIDFDNLNIPFLSTRADESWEYYLSSGYRLAPGWFLRGQLTFVDHQSNIEAFDYERLVASIGISWRF